MGTLGISIVYRALRKYLSSYKHLKYGDDRIITRFDKCGNDDHDNEFGPREPFNNECHPRGNRESPPRMDKAIGEGRAVYLRRNRALGQMVEAHLWRY